MISREMSYMRIINIFNLLRPMQLFPTNENSSYQQKFHYYGYVYLKLTKLQNIATTKLPTFKIQDMNIFTNNNNVNK